MKLHGVTSVGGEGRRGQTVNGDTASYLAVSLEMAR